MSTPATPATPAPTTTTPPAPPPKLNVYAFTVIQKSDVATGNVSGRLVNVVSTSPEAASGALAAALGDDVLNIQGPGQVNSEVLMDPNAMTAAPQSVLQPAPASSSASSGSGTSGSGTTSTTPAGSQPTPDTPNPATSTTKKK